MDISLFNIKTIYPLARWGFKAPAWGINIDTIATTWLCMALVIFIGIAVKKIIQNHSSKAFWLLYTGITEIRAMIEESIGFFAPSIFFYLFSIFIFTLSLNLIGLLPGLSEPTKDINTTFALAIICFGYIQYNSIEHRGIEHLKDFFRPLPFMLPLTLLSECAKIPSFAFRLFGNIIAGAIILDLLITLLAKYAYWIEGYLIFYSLLFLLATKIPLLKNNSLFKWLGLLLFFPAAVQTFFGIIEGTLQAFILSMLTLTSIGIELQKNPPPLEKQPT